MIFDLDGENFFRLMTAVAEIHGKEFSELMLDVYWNALEQFSFDDVRRAVSSHLTNPDTGQFFPKPADLIRAIEGCTVSQAALAWSKILKAIKNVGHCDSVVFDDEKIHAVIEDMGGWVELCKTTEKETPFKKNDFEKRYRYYATNSPTVYLKKLTGLFEQQNLSNGRKVAPPVLIGDVEKAKKVFLGGANDLALPVQKFSAIVSAALGALGNPTNEPTLRENREIDAEASKMSAMEF